MPLDEVRAEGLPVRRSLHVTLPEFNLSSDFTVTGIDACPTPASGDGHLVTSRFIHENTDVWNLSFERGSEPLGTTASHSFWSEDQQDFVAAADLHRGERLLLADGTTRRLESLTKRPELTTVYNIEVNAQHTYYVGHDGVLVHNACGPRTIDANGRWHDSLGRFTQSPDPGLVIGRLDDLDVLRPGERSLLSKMKENLGSPAANWKRNSALLRSEMRKGIPIRDASIAKPDSFPVPTPDFPDRTMRQTFTGMERNLLRNEGWTLQGEFWIPPAP